MSDSGIFGLLKGYARFCISGFGLGVNAARAFGVAVLIFTVFFVVAFCIIRWLVLFIINRNKAKKEADAQTPEQ